MYPETKTLAKLGETYRNSLNAHWPCMCPGCKERAINTHFLQQRGILDAASDSHKYRELKYKYPVYWSTDDNSNYEFNSYGITQALSYPVFCSKHDTELFKRIERGKLDLDDYKGQLLFSFRTLCGEIRKIEIALKHIVMLKSVGIEVPINDSTLIHIHTLTNTGDILRRYKEEMINEINNPTGNHIFKHYTYPKFEVYASAIMGSNFDISIGHIQYSPVCFVHIVPTKDSLEVLLGYPLNKSCPEFMQYVESWNGLDNESLGWKLTELFANRLENFGISEELYHKISKDKLMAFKSYVTRNTNLTNTQVNGIGFNLFEGLI